MEFSDPWDVADAMGAPSSRESRREMMEEDYDPEDMEGMHRAAELCAKFGIFTTYNRADAMTQLTEEFKNYFYISTMEKINIVELQFQSVLMAGYYKYQELYEDQDIMNKEDILLSLAFVAVHLAINELADQVDGNDILDMACVVEAYLGGLSENE